MGPRGTIELLWALLVGLPMGGVAYVMDFPTLAVELVAVMGGLGAAAFVFMFWTSLTRRPPPSKGG